MHHKLPALYGLVLAGGRARRLGRDKGALDFHGQAQVDWAFALLADCCDSAYVSVRADQAAAGAPYSGKPLLVDDGAEEGPAAGLLAAWRMHPAGAWLALAVDLPLVDRSLMRALIAARDPAAIGTAYRHPDGTPEPLCAIFEPRTRAAVAAQPGGRMSLRHVLEHADAKLLDPPDPAVLRSVNSAADLTFVQERLALRAPRHIS